MANLKQLIQRHKNFWEKYEKPAFMRARKFYRGEFWSVSETSFHDTDTLARNLLGSKNIIYAIADTAVSSLLGPNPQVAARPRNERGEEASPMINGLMSWVFTQNRMRRRAALTLVDAVLCKRGIFKIGWSKDKDQPVIKAIDPSALFFDHDARDPDDIRYWLEATVVPWSTYKERVEKGKYVAHPDVTPDRYPRWLLDATQHGDMPSTRDSFKYVTVWEFYDREKETVMHYVEQADAAVFEDRIDYIPYSMYSLNHSGVDCLGLSEVQLVLSQQQTINDLLTHVKQIVYLMVPRVLYDAGRISEEDLNAAVESAVGSFVGISPDNSDNLRTLAALFYEMPMPRPPDDTIKFIERQEADAAYISAIADAARGKVTGARTATEMAIIDAQSRTRLATREGHLNDAIEDVATKAFYLCQKYMQQDKLVRIAGDRKWAQVNYETLKDVVVDFEMVSYNPIRQNPSVVMEQLSGLLPVLLKLPFIDQYRLMEEIADGLGIPRRIFIPESEFAEMKMQQTQAAAAPAAPELAGPSPEALAAGGAPGAEAAIAGQPTAAEQGFAAGVIPQQALAGMAGGAPVGPIA